MRTLVKAIRTSPHVSNVIIMVCNCVCPGMLQWVPLGSRLHPVQLPRSLQKDFPTLNWCSVIFMPCGASWLSCSVCSVQAGDRGFDPQLCWICSDIVFLGKALCSHVPSLNLGGSGYLVGQWRPRCLNSCVHWTWQPGYMLPMGMAYEQTGPVTRG